MEESAAREIIKRLFALVPAAKTYHAKNVDPDQKGYVYSAWVRALSAYDFEDAEQALNELATVSPKDADAVCYPVQTLVDRIKARRPRPRTDITPSDRTPRESNMRESYLLARQAYTAGDEQTYQQVLSRFK